MKKIEVKLKERSYPIFVGTKIKDLGSYLKKARFGSKVMVITNPAIKSLYFSKLNTSLKKAGFEVNTAVIPDGERYKNLDTIKKLYYSALKYGMDRTSCVIALGGGVVGDIAGFFAATYLRGIAFVQVPTSLLAMVDSSVGGKTGVDLPQGKNLVGAFYQPKLVWIDISTLSTLPKRELRNGMAEVIKYGIIKDASFFKFLENCLGAIYLPRRSALSAANRTGQRAGDIQRTTYDIQHTTYEKIITRCCQIKTWVVINDEKEEKGIREILNLGHTFAHAIETLTGYKAYKHGEAVAIGMNMAGRLAVLLGIFAQRSQIKIEDILVKAGLPVQLKEKFPFQYFIDVIKRDKKVRNGKLRFVLPTEIGKVIVHKGVPPRKLVKII